MSLLIFSTTLKICQTLFSCYLKLNKQYKNLLLDCNSTYYNSNNYIFVKVLNCCYRNCYYFKIVTYYCSTILNAILNLYHNKFLYSCKVLSYLLILYNDKFLLF